LCKQQAEVVQNQKDKYAVSIGQGEKRHKIIRGLTLAAVKLTTVKVTKLPL
jgi:hypothetical protein